MNIVAFHGTTHASYLNMTNSGIAVRARPRPRWLGDGVYFYQDAPSHAAAWARVLSAIRGGDTPVVLRAEISLKNCVDLLDKQYWNRIERLIAGIPLPPRSQLGVEALLRQDRLTDTERRALYKNYADDYYMNQLTYALTKTQRVDSMRASFIEGRPVHPTSWLFDQSHVQICVKNPEAIKATKWFEITEDGGLKTYLPP